MIAPAQCRDATDAKAKQTVGEGLVTQKSPRDAVAELVNAGNHQVRMGSDNWAVYSQDGSLTAHFEHTVAITAEGPRILTPWHLEASERSPVGAPAASGA